MTAARDTDPAPTGLVAGRTCVIVDDMPLMREAMRLRVEELGMKVIGTAEDGIAAVRMVVELAPDLLIVDLNMPQMDGIQVIRRLAEMEVTTRTLLYTADPRAQVVDLAMQAGANGCISKSVGHDTLALPVPLRLEIQPVDLSQSAHLADRL